MDTERTDFETMYLEETGLPARDGYRPTNGYCLWLELRLAETQGRLAASRAIIQIKEEVAVERGHV